MYLAFDPGKVTGWARFDEAGEVQEMGQLTLEELVPSIESWLDTEDSIEAVIYEDFIVFRHKAQKMAGSRMEASQAIGLIKGLAQRAGCKIVKQNSSIKPIAERWTQVKPPSDHSQSHQIDAYNHGKYYLINEGICKSALEENNGQV